MRTDRIELYRSGLLRKFYWRYVHWNGNILADSGQGYGSKEDALQGALTVTGTQHYREEGVFAGVDRIGGERRVKLVDLT